MQHRSGIKECLAHSTCTRGGCGGSPLQHCSGIKEYLAHSTRTRGGCGGSPLRLAFICASLVLAMSISAYSAPAVESDFGAVAKVEISGGLEYKAIRLTPEIYADTKENLADIVLYSGDEIVPYFINNTQLVSDTIKTGYELTFSNSFVKDGFRYFDYELLPLRENDIRATSLKTNTQDEFVKHIELFGSYDGLVWDKVAEEKLYNVDGNQQLEIPFHAEQKYTHYRLKLPPAQDKLTFRTVWLEYNTETVTRTDFISKISPEFDIREDNKTTVISLKDIKHLPLASIEINTNSIFKRTVSAAGSQDVLYNLEFAGEEYKKLSIPLSGYKSSSDALEIRISNGDDAPINVNSVTVNYLSDELIFKNPGGNSISLYFGHELITSPPQYDIGSYREYIIAQGYDTLNIGEIDKLYEKADKNSEFDYSLIFNITIVLVAVVLAFLIIIRLRKARA